MRTVVKGYDDTYCTALHMTLPETENYPQASHFPRTFAIAKYEQSMFVLLYHRPIRNVR